MDIPTSSNEFLLTPTMNYNFVNNENNSSLSHETQKPNIFGNNANDYKALQWTQIPQQMPWAQNPSEYSQVMTFGSPNFFHKPSDFQDNPSMPAICNPDFDFSVPSTSSSNLSYSNSEKHMDQNRHLNPTYRFRSSLHCKRKSNVGINAPTKQHITEERMAQHMSRLHISSETPLPIQLEQDEANEQSAERERRLVMCEEMRRLQTDSIIPSALMRRVKPTQTQPNNFDDIRPKLYSSLERPCMAVMLWQPPDKVTGHNLASIINSSKSSSSSPSTASTSTEEPSPSTSNSVDNNNTNFVMDLNRPMGATRGANDEGDMDMDL